MVLQHLTPRTEQLVREVWTKTRSWSISSRISDKRPAVIAEVAASGERAAIPCLFGLLFDSAPTVSQSTCDALHHLVSIIPHSELPTFDEDMRNLPYWMYTRRWEDFDTSRLVEIERLSFPKASIIGLASLHRSGFVRESAVALLNQIKDGSELPFLLLRLNDWVDAVRVAALEAVRVRQVASYVDHFARNIALVMRLIDCGRAKGEDVVRWVFSQLVLPQNQAVLFGLLRDSLPRLGRRLFKNALEHCGNSSEELIKFGIASADGLVRLSAARHASRLLKDNELDRVLRSLEQDHFMPVRRLALTIEIERHSAAAESILVSALMDNSASMRELARFHLTQLGMTDLASVYRQTLAEQNNQAIALAGLGETGTRSDIDLVRPFIKSPNTRERLAAVRSLATLGGSEVVSELAGLLPDDRVKVTRAAGEGLKAHVGSLDKSLLWNLASNDRRFHVRREAIGLLDKSGAWSGLTYLLRLLSDGNADVAKLVKWLINTRVNRVFTNPNQDEQRMLEETMANMQLADDRPFAENLRAWLRSRGVGLAAL